MPDPARTRPVTPVLGGVVSLLAVVTVIVLLMSRSDRDTTDLGARTPSTAAAKTKAPRVTLAARTRADYRPGAQQAASDGLPVLVADPLPSGWTLTLAEYDADARVWHLSAVTGGGDTVDLWQADADVASLRAEHASGGVQGDDLDLSELGTGVWSTWSGAAVAVLATDLGPTSVILVGGARSDVELAATRLLPFG